MSKEFVPNSGIEGDKQTTRATADATYDAALARIDKEYPHRNKEFVPNSDKEFVPNSGIERDKQMAEAKRVYAAGVAAAYDADADAYATYKKALDRINKEYPA